MIESDRLIPQPFLDWYGIWAGQTGIGESGQAWVQDPPGGYSWPYSRLRNRRFS